MRLVCSNGPRYKPVMLLYSAIAIGTFLISCVGVRMLIPILIRRAILDHPIHRSSHNVPTPRGGGLVVSTTILMVWMVMLFFVPLNGLIFIIVGAGILAGISWLDDVQSQSAAVRLSVQALAVCVGMVWLIGQGLVFQGFVPAWLDLFLASIIWLGFLNFFNFMDGIDGISAVQGGAVSLGLCLIAFAAPASVLTEEDGIYAMIVLAAVAGFAVWNWHPARVFLGDVGSIPLGFVLGGLLLALAARGAWAPAVILPSYYLADAGFTLLRRAIKREPVWQAHKQHFYQQAVQRGFSHSTVSAAILGANTVIVGAAFISLENPWAGLGLAAVATVLLLVWMARWPVTSS